MYNPENSQFIFRDVSGKFRSVFFDERLGLCLSLLSRKNTWMEPQVLFRESSKYFCATLDSNDVIHILFQDKIGDLHYAEVTDCVRKTLPLLKSKLPEVYDKHLNITLYENTPSFYFVLKHGEEKILAQQVMIADTPATPKVIDYVQKNKIPYAILCDKAGIAYAFYQLSDGKHHQLGYKKTISSQKNWSEFTPITMNACHSEYPIVMNDAQGIIHLCYQKQTLKQYELVYQQKIPDRNIWTSEHVLHTSAYPFHTASIVSTPEGLVVFWVREDVIYFCSASDGGSKWSKPARNNFSISKQLLCLCYKTNYPAEYEKFFARYIPGSFINGIKFAFYQLSTSDTQISTEDMKHLIVDTLKDLGAEVKDLKEAHHHIHERFSEIQALQQNTEKELVKHALRFEMLTEQYHKYKKSDSHMEDIENLQKEHYTTLMALSDGIQELKQKLEAIEKKLSSNESSS